METFIQQIINGLVLGSMYALVALGYTMVYGVLNLINFAHGDVLMIGAMVGLSILNLLDKFMPGLPGYLNLAIAMAGAIPVCMLLNILIERVAYRRLRNAPRLAPLITAIGVSTLLTTIAMMIWGRSPLSFPQLLPSEPVEIGGAVITVTQILLLALAAISMALLVLLVEKTRLGRAMRATAENPRVAGLMGVDANKVVVATFAIGAALAAVAGVMWGANYSTVQFAMGFMPGLKAFSAAVLGGIGNIYGAMVGGLLLGLIEAMWSAYFTIEYKDFAAFSILVLVLIFRPTGILGRPEIEKV